MLERFGFVCHDDEAEESHERFPAPDRPPQLEEEAPPPKSMITNPEELKEIQLKKRMEMEDLVRRTGRWNLPVWIKYATFEEEQRCVRATGVIWSRRRAGLEMRRLPFDAGTLSARGPCTSARFRSTIATSPSGSSTPKWRCDTASSTTRAICMTGELAFRAPRDPGRHGGRSPPLSRARLGRRADGRFASRRRAVQLLPRIDQLWYKFIHMEEMLGNFQGVRNIFERWMDWEPDMNAWQHFVHFEIRYGEIDRARAIFERFIRCHPKVEAYVRYAKFEVKHGQPSLGRRVYERAFEDLGEDAETEELFKVRVGAGLHVACMRRGAA